MPADPDQWRAASHRNMIAHLTGPFAAGAVDTPLAPTVVGGGGRVTIAWISREPLLLVAPAAPLEQRGLRLAATLAPTGAAIDLPPLVFAPYSEAGAFLPLYQPPVDPTTRMAAPFEIKLELFEVAEDGSETAVSAADLATRIDIRVVEGVMGRMIYLLGAEKQRLRRQGRELMAMHPLDTARDDALDRIGAGLGVPRLPDNLIFANGAVTTETRREPDAEYRRRLSIYRPFLMPSRRNLLALLNGPPGDDTDPNAGLLGRLGFVPRFHLREDNNPFAVAIHLVAAGDQNFRGNFLDFIRKVYLIWPANTPPANKVHFERFLPAGRRTRELALRVRLRKRYSFRTGAAIAPMLAAALDRLARCRRLLGENTALTIQRAQQNDAGSRYELGLGVDVEPPTAAELDRMAAALAGGLGQTDDPEIEALLRAMVPRRAADDPEGRWLLEGCGLRTVHRVDRYTIYLSHLPTFGLAISGSSNVALGAKLALEARYHAPGDPGSNVVLAEGLARAADDWAAAGGPAWTALTDATARMRWDQATPRQLTAPALGVFRAAGLPAVQAPAAVVQRLKRLPEELIETIQLAPVQAQRIIAGQTGAIDELRNLTAILRRQGLSSVLPLITGPNEVVLVVGVIGLPEAGINLAERRATGFRWYVVPIRGSGGQVKVVGSRTEFVPSGAGLSALVAIGYARRGATDPYEYRVELPAGARLDLLQYEFLMNLLDHTFPIGVEVNTFSIRQQHVDLDGNGDAEPLPPTVSRTFRQFRRPRSRGEIGVTLDEGD